MCQSNLHTLPILNESDWCQPNAMTVTANQCNLMYSVIFAAMMYVNDLNKIRATRIKLRVSSHSRNSSDLSLNGWM